MVRIGACVALSALAISSPVLAQPACSTGSPDPLAVKSWTTTPDPEHGDNAVRIDYVLTNNLDVDILDFRAAASYWRDGQEVLYHSLYNDVAPLIAAGGDVTGSVIAMSAPPYLSDDPSSLTVIACTTQIVKVDESLIEY